MQKAPFGYLAAGRAAAENQHELFFFVFYCYNPVTALPQTGPPNKPKVVLSKKVGEKNIYNQHYKYDVYVSVII